jgi:cell division protein FtsL
MEANKIKDKPKENKKRKPRKVGLGIASATRKLLGSDKLAEGTFRFFPFVLFIAFLAFLYIANNYYAEHKVRNISKLQKELKEIKYEHISTKSKLMQLSRQSQIAKKMEHTGVKESTEPVKIIRTGKEGIE